MTTAERLLLKSLLCVLLFGFIPGGLLPAQDINIDNYVGLNFVKNYSPDDYKRQSQNWWIAQDHRGIIYVANQNCLLEYDSVSWRVLEVPNVYVRSVAVDDSGTLYVGGFNEIGFFSPDSRGRMYYTSLVNDLENNQKDFKSVWGVHALKQNIFFRTSEYLFRWDKKDKQMKVWRAKKIFTGSFICNEKFYIQQRDSGLMEVVNDSLKTLPGLDFLSENRNRIVVIPYDAGQLLIGLQSKGLYLYDGVRCIPFPSDADGYLQEKSLYYGSRLSGGDFALATLHGGLVIIDRLGKLVKVFTKASGLQDESVKHVFEDFQGNLWLALEKGIAKIEYGSPISFYDDNRSNLPGINLAVIRHGPKNDLYVGTTRGLFVLASSSPDEFRNVLEIHDFCSSLLSIENSLFVASSKGVWEIKNNNKEQLSEGYSYSLLQSARNSRRIWVGTNTGLVSLYRDENTNKWAKEKQLEEITDLIQTIVEDPNGNLWLGLDPQGVIKIAFPAEGSMSSLPSFLVTRFGSAQGLPNGAVRAFWAANHVMLATGEGIFRFIEEKNRFEPDNTLGKEFSSVGREVFLLTEDKKKNLWIHSANRNFQGIPQPDGTYVIIKEPFLRMPLVQVNAFYPDPDGKTTWFATSEGLIGFDTTVNKNYRLDFSCFIRETAVNGLPLIFDGITPGYKPADLFKEFLPEVPYGKRNLRFEFAAPFFEVESRTLYQCLLEGYDHHWSELKSEPQMAYTNLDAGRYTFRVRAQNIYGYNSREDSFEFKVLLPWYKKWWAFLVYAAALFLMVFFIVKWRSWKLVQEKQRLEQIVKERTKEIKEKNLQLEEQSEKLKEMDKVKSRFFANISHEFRTPLTLIMGPLEQMLSRSSSQEQKQNLNLMMRNSQRLLNLINQLLDLSRFDSGKMKLQALRCNIIPFLKGIVDSFSIAAHQHEVNLAFHTDTDNITLFFDPEKMEHVMCNLLINAIKFTPPGGKITVSAAAGEEIMEISVRDTGIGIPREQLEYIFDRFFQAKEPSRTHHLKGTGIGLALTRELVNLHHGKIDVHSRVGESSGTEFMIRLPMGDSHLKPDEIIDLSQLAPEEKNLLHAAIPAAFMWEGEQAGTDSPVLAEEQEKDIILVVEDSKDLRTYIRSALEPVYTVVDAGDGEQGILKAKEIIPDLVVSDVMMPGPDGFELARVLKKDVLTSHIPIILLTAKASEADILEGLETGVDDYITKPFNTAILCARIKNLIDLRRQLQQNLKREISFQPVKTSLSPVDKEFLNDLNKTIEKNLADTDFNVEQLSKKLYMSRATLYRKMMGLTGGNPTDYIRDYRLKRGAELLKNNFGTVLEVALEVGFSSSAYFTKCFKEKFHQLPSEWSNKV